MYNNTMMNLYPYQRADVEALHRKLRQGLTGVGNLSDTGTGKTPTAITLIEESGVLDGGYGLVACPKSLVYNWADEWSRWYPHREVEVVLDSTKKRAEQLRTRARKGVVFLTNFHTVRALGSQIRPSVLALDEAHAIKNRDSQLAKSIKKIPTDMRVALTATPMDWKEFDIWSILNWLDPVTYGPRKKGATEETWPFWKWAGKYGEWRQGRWGWEYVGPRDNLREELAEELLRYVVRRTADDPSVVAVFPEVHMSYRRVGWYPRQQSMHESIRKDHAAITEANGILFAPNMAAQLVRMQQIADNPAIVGGPDQSEKMEYIVDLLATTRPIAVFSKYLTALDLLATRLKDYRVGWITGRQGPKAREQAYRAANNGDIDVVLCTYGAGAEGINLLLPHMVMLDQPWPYRDWYQAISRVRRPTNRHRHVQVDVLLTGGSIDEYVAQVLGHKKDVNERLLFELMRGG